KGGQGFPAIELRSALQFADGGWDQARGFDFSRTGTNRLLRPHQSGDCLLARSGLTRKPVGPPASAIGPESRTRANLLSKEISSGDVSPRDAPAPNARKCPVRKKPIGIKNAIRIVLKNNYAHVEP